MEPLAAAEDLVERLVRAELEEDVDVVVVLEEVLKSDDVLVLEGTVDLDLGQQLGSGLTFWRARVFVSELLAMSLAAYFRLGVSTVSTS